MSAEKTAAMTVGMKKEVLLAAKSYQKKARRIISSGEVAPPHYAPSVCRELCLKAKEAARSIGEFEKRNASEVRLAREMMEEYAESAVGISESALCEYIFSKGKKYGSVTLAVLPHMLFAVIFLRISGACAEEGESASRLVSETRRICFVDFARIFFEFSSVNAIFSSELAGIYPMCDGGTKEKYVEKLVSLAEKQGKSEDECALALVRSANAAGVHVGELLFEKSSSVPKIYSLCLALITLAASILYVILCGADAVALLALPAATISCYEAVKELLGICFRCAGSDGLLRLEGERVKKEKAVVAIMSIISGGERDAELFERLENFFVADENPNRFYAVVCNLPDSNRQKGDGDENIIRRACEKTEALNAKYGYHFGIFIRRRRYSRTEEKYIGWERKRGAVLELCRFMRGQSTSICRYIADEAFLSESKYLITLDADTDLYAGAADELIGVMLHPQNTPKIKNGRVASGHGIVQPHIAPTLESAASSAFATVTSGNGGIDSYAGAAFDIYENVFESGCFCGKGIIDVDVFLQTCGDFFPCERILSHDLAEGNMAGAAIASDITLTDSAPRSALAYYTRLHRWIRGDLQILPYLLPYVRNAEGKRIKNPMTALDKYKIADNAAGAALPLLSLFAAFMMAAFSGDKLLTALPFLFAFIIFPVLRAAVSLFLPGGAKMAARKFHSRVMPHLMGGIAYSFYKLCALPYEAYIFGDAAVRTAYRFLVSKKNFLNWKTAAAADGEKNGYGAYLIRMSSSFAAGVAALLMPSAVFKALGVLWLLYPTLAYLMSMETKPCRELTQKQRAALSEYSLHMWGYFRDLVDESTSFLPPDNYAVSPKERIAYRTSPTNIGLYLASLLGARDMGFITCEELRMRAQSTAHTIGAMAKWHGHLYNWYDIKSLDILGEPFVSTVDSGNFICALCAFCRGLAEYEAECPRLSEVRRLYEDIIKNTDFSALYDKSARLFYIGYDVRKERFSESYYDTFMSESRMTGFYAVAAGQVPREHFFAPSRPIISRGGYLGVASWSGTVFEYFMPALFLPTVPNSLAEEALCFAYRAEKQFGVRRRIFGKKRRIFGVSESGYWHFDAEMNYQYKAFGLSPISLDPNCRNSAVVSPYSSFLMLRCGASECLENLATLKKLGAYGAYGFYEALDCERHRVGEGYAIVRSFMAHHVGMSFIAAVNALKDDVFPRRFMSAPKMRAFRELLCERIRPDARLAPKTAKDPAEYGKVSVKTAPESAAAEKLNTPYNIAFPKAAMLSNNKTRIVASSSGHIAVYSGERTVFRSEFDRFSLGGGLRFCLEADGEAHPLVPLGAACAGWESSFDFVCDGESITYISKHGRGERHIEARLTLRVCGDREVIFAECRAWGDLRDARLFVYGEPLMEREKAFLSHRCFSGLFLESSYACDEDALVFRRRSRTGEAPKNFLGVRAYPPVYGGDFDTLRDAVLPKIYSGEDIAELALRKGGGTLGAVITPMLAMRTYNEGAGGSMGFAFACASGEEDALYLLSERRPFSKKIFADVERLQRGASRMGDAEMALKDGLLRSFLFGSVGRMPSCRLPADVFWRHGISGENRTLAVLVRAFEAEERGRICSVLRVFKYMCVCGERFDLILIYNESDLYRNSNKSALELCVEGEGCGGFIGRENGIHLISENAFSEDELYTFCSVCDARINLSSEALAVDSVGYFDISPDARKDLLRRPHTSVKEKSAVSADHIAHTPVGDFTEKGFAVIKPHFGAPFASVICGEEFGFVASENSLGFSYFENSALGKLTPHTADALSEDVGERLILRAYAEFGDACEDYDLCACAERVEYEGGAAIYRGSICGCAYAVYAEADEAAPIKRIRVELYGAKGKKRLIFRASPCLGEHPLKERRYIFERSCGCVFARDVLENPLSLAIFTTGKNAGFYENEGALISDGRIFCGREIAAVCADAGEGHSVTDFYLGAICSSFSKDELRSRAEDFRAKSLRRSFKGIQAHTSEPVFDLSVNLLFPYQTYYSRLTARTGYHQVGGAFGYRDQLQDSLSFIDSEPELCRRQILRCAAHQYGEGDVAHWWHVFRGRETGLRSRCSDDLLWLPFALCEYVEKTGDTELLYEKAPYLSSRPLDERENERYEELSADGEDMVIDHALKAVRLVMARGFGAHGLIKIGGGDWNDGMNLVGLRGKGESVWLTEFFAIVASRLSRLLREIGRGEDADFLEDVAPALKNGVDNAFSEEWYLRGYYDDGAPLGAPGATECEIDSLSQSFAVFMEQELFGEISERTAGAMLKAYEKLYENGVMRLLSPPFGKGSSRPGYIKGYPEGIRENGGQYTHAAVWAAMALLLCCESTKGVALLRAINPALRSLEGDFCKKYRAEPYAMAGDVYARAECFGRGGWSHYTGAAAWYKKAVTEYLFGLRTERGGFKLEPHMDESFDGAELELDIRGTRYRIRYVFHEEEGMLLDGEMTRTELLPFDGKEHIVERRIKTIAEKTKKRCP